MGTPVVVVSSGGLPVTTATNGYGMPIEVAANGYGIPITYVTSSGLPVVQGGGAPSGYTASTFKGVSLTFGGAPLFDNFPATPFSVRTA